MKLKQFDFFRKVNTDIHQGTKVGGIISVAAMILATILIIEATSDYLNPKLLTFLTVKNDQQPFLQVSIQILFNHWPCQAISVIWVDSSGNMKQQMPQSSIQRKILDKNEKFLFNVREFKQYVSKAKKQDQIQDVKKGIDNQYQCLISGNFKISKTSGFIKFIKQPTIISKIEENYQSKLRNSYLLKLLKFGKIQQSFQLPIHQSKYSKLIRVVNQYIAGFSQKKIQSFLNYTEPHQFISHVKVIPVRFGQRRNHTFNYQYIYSLKSGMTALSNSKFSTSFLIEMSPINLVYYYEEKGIYFFLIEILAVLGGLFSAMGIINGIASLFLK